MAEITLERLAEGIRRANAAGDVETVRKLGTAYRQLQAGGSDVPPAGAQPGSREYADWALQQARAGKKLPQVSPTPPEADVPQPNGLMDKVLAGSGSFIEGVPIAGPTLIDWAKKGRAAVQGMSPEAVDAEFAAAKEANPVTSIAGGVGGSIAALAPLGATALGGKLLGMTGGIGSRIGFGMGSGGLLAGADTLARGGSWSDAGQNMLLGAGLGAAFPVAGAAFRKALSPVAGSASKSAAANVLKREGVDLTAGQITGNRGLRYREAELGGNAAADFMERQADQFTAAALKRVGVQASRATPDVVDSAFSTIGQQFDDLAMRNGLQADSKLGADLKKAWDTFKNTTAPSNRPDYVYNLLKDIHDKGFANGHGLIDGEWYKSVRSDLARRARSTSNPEFGEALRDIMEAMDDAMERTIAMYNPGDAGAWREARRLYRNMLVVEDAVGRAGEKAADGIITPQALRSAALKQNKRAFIRGKSEFTDLANAGVKTMTPLPDSGTPGRLSAKTFVPIGAATGAGIGGTVGNLPGAAIGGLIGAAVPWAAGKAMLSAPGRAYLSNQMVTGKALPALAPAILPLEVTKRRPLEITVGRGRD